MKVLVTYFSQTGNTEKIAKEIFKEAFRENEVELKKLEEADPRTLDGYDLIFVGSPLHAGSLAGPVKEFLNAMKVGSGQKIAGFITHAAPAYPDQDMDKFSEPIKTACREKGMAYEGCFDCQGFLTEALHEMIKKSQNLSDAQWADRVNQMTGHPDAEDLNKARAFAKAILS